MEMQEQNHNPPAVPQQPYNYTTPINASHYRMLITGSIDDLSYKIANCNLSLSTLITHSDNSSALHIAAMAGQDDLICFIVDRFNGGNDSQHGHQNPLLRPNSKGDLPIHVAARAGKLSSVEKLVECATNGNIVDSMLGQGNHNDDTPLHIALENRQKNMSLFLFQAYRFTFYRLNKQNRCPLYLAIKAAFWDLVQRMLDIDCPDVEAEGLLDKGKVIHAAIMANNLNTFKMILEKYRELVRSSDEKQRRPLSYAAYTGFLEGIDHFLRNNNLLFANMAFKPDDDGSFPIHWACRGGNVQAVERFIEHSRDIMWLLNGKGQNILHVAAESGKAKVTGHILGLAGSDSLVNMKDEEGNTPLHLASKGKHPEVVYALTWDHRVELDLQNNKALTALDIAEDYGQIPSFQERLTWLALIHAGVPRAPLFIQPTVQTENEAAHNQNPNDLSNRSFVVLPYIGTREILIQNPYPDGFVKQKSPSNKYKERLNTLLVVSTLAATVTFASGFTVPGGYKQDSSDIGMAILSRRRAFQVFVISNTVALFSSILAAVTLIWAHLDDLRLILLALDFALPLLGISLAGMSVAFMAGLYVTLHTQLWLGIVVLVMGGSFLGALFVFFIPFYSPTSRIKSKLLRCIFHVPFKLMLLASEKGNSTTLY